MIRFRPRVSLPYDKLIQVALENKANLNWLFTGRGEMGVDPDLYDENEHLKIEPVKIIAIYRIPKRTDSK